jgi:hypothetical protein
MVQEQYGKATQAEFMLMEKELNKFRSARKQMLSLYKDNGWQRKKSASRDKSVDTVVSKKIVIKEKVPVPMKTRRTLKVLNEAKNGFDLIKL